MTTFRLEIVGKLMKQIIGINVANIETQGMSFLFSRHIFSIAMSSGSVEGAANITLIARENGPFAPKRKVVFQKPTINFQVCLFQGVDTYIWQFQIQVL